MATHAEFSNKELYAVTIIWLLIIDRFIALTEENYVPQNFM